MDFTGGVLDPVWIGLAFGLGFLVRQVGLPPLVGFLIAGFLLRWMGVEKSAALQQLADVGVWLLLFSIGLKLELRSLLRREVWATASVHMAATVAVFGGLLFGLSAAGLTIVGNLDLTAALIIAFAASFSSTVFAIKVLEEKGEGDSRHGRIAVGILVVQDIFAVFFMTVSAGVMPSPWALSLLGLVLLRPLIFWVLDRSGHGELLVLLGILIPMGGAALFYEVGLKPDLGAIVLGVLLAAHPKAGELARSLFSFKDLFLVGFFLTIGLSSTPTAADLGVAGLLVLLLPLKIALLYILLTGFQLRARTATLTTLPLANYSEFGLIVAGVAVSAGWLGGEWPGILAIALSISFVLASPLNVRSHRLFNRLAPLLKRFESPDRLPEDRPMAIGGADIVIFGMGRVGTATYEALAAQGKYTLLGVDQEQKTVAAHQSDGLRVVLGDATDLEFWSRIESYSDVKLAILTMAKHTENKTVARQLRTGGYRGKVVAMARHGDQLGELKALGVDSALDFFAEAGTGLARHARQALKSDSQVQ